MIKDSYDEVLNGEETYKEIATCLEKGAPIMIGWTDGLMSHFDILFNYSVEAEGHFQRGLRKGDLFVSVMSVGAFGFEVTAEPTHPGYIDEKFGNFFGKSSAEKLAELINGVKAAIVEIHEN